MYRWNPIHDGKPTDDIDHLLNDQTIKNQKINCCSFDFFDESIDSYRDELWNVIRVRKDLKFYIYISKIQRYKECICDDFKEIQKNIYVIYHYDDNTVDFYNKCKIQHKCILIDPLDHEIQLQYAYQHVFCKGDMQKICDYDWVLKLHSYCKEHVMSFTFLSTGTNFKKDGKCYKIPKSKQKEQAKKANLDLDFSDWYSIDVFKRLKNSKFRNQFHLKSKDIDYINRVGIKQIENHAYDFVKTRLSSAVIENDGKQTPMKGHPIFVAQHATACCCRGCLKKWHNIEKDVELTKNEQNYIVSILMKWIEREVSNYR